MTRLLVETARRQSAAGKGFPYKDSKSMDVYFASLGCARNQVDSEIMCQQLRQRGWQVVDDPEIAGAIVVNTCGFIEPAAQESVDTILELATYKHRGNCRRLVVVGCLPQRYGRQISQALPEVDIFLGTGGFDRLVEALEGKVPQGACLLPDPAAAKPSAGVKRRPFVAYQAYLKIAEGCNRHCTYCIIPRLRGPQRSLPASSLVKEAAALVEQGAREITLVAQETTAWGRDLEGDQNLAGLLEQLAGLDQGVWIRFFYGHPESFDPRIMDVMQRFDNLCPYLDLPIQHASDSVLKAMGRQYRRKDLENLFGTIGKHLPSAALRTTVMVGFPGESQSDFEALVELVRQVQFDHLGVFIYSDGDDLAAHNLPRHVPRDTALQRYHRLMEIQQQISARRNQRFRGQKLQVLIETRSEETVYLGRTMFQGPEVDGLTFVHNHSPSPLRPGQIVRVNISDSMEYDLVGETV